MVNPGVGNAAPSHDTVVGVDTDVFSWLAVELVPRSEGIGAEDEH